MSFRIIGEPVSLSITPELARQWCDMRPVPQDRPLNHRRADKHRKSHGAGKMRPVLWAKVMCRETGEWYRANGKHTSFVFAPMTQEQIDAPAGGQTAIIETYEADTMTDVAELYNTYDSKTQGRTQEDINRSLAATVDAFDGYDIRMMNLCGSALAFADNPNQPHKISGDDKGHLLIVPDNRGVIVWMNATLTKTGLHTLHMRRVPVMAAMVVTYRLHEGIAELFWQRVRDKEGADAHLPVRKLAEFLSTSAINRGKGVESGRYKTSQREFYCKCITAWNAFRDSTPTNLAYHASKPIPKAI